MAMNANLCEVLAMTAILSETARPFWLDHDCPSWCTAQHYDGDGEAERRHFHDTGTVEMVLHESVGIGCEPERVHVSLAQPVREIAPYVEVYEPTQNAVLKLTLSEAAALADALNKAVAAGRNTPESEAHHDAEPICTPLERARVLGALTTSEAHILAYLMSKRLPGWFDRLTEDLPTLTTGAA
jgi:hypothetical protein